jgi:hypothetical protein
MKIANTITALFLSFASLAANATILTQTQAQTVAGQDFTFTFANLSKNFSGNGTLTLSARGDYSTGVSDEFIVAAAEGVNFTNSSYANKATGSTITANDTQWTRKFNLSHSQLDTLLADGTLTFTAFLSSGVDIISAQSAVSVIFEYSPLAVTTVPEPGSMLLLGIAVAGLSVARRRKQ